MISQLHAEMIMEDIQYGLNEHHRTRRNDPLCPLLDMPLRYLRRSSNAPNQLVVSEITPSLTPQAAKTWRERWRENQHEIDRLLKEERNSYFAQRRNPQTENEQQEDTNDQNENSENIDNESDQNSTADPSNYTDPLGPTADPLNFSEIW